jgi:hypothetical protein
MKAAADAFESWKHSTPSVRQKAINDIADVMEEHMNELIETEIENTGKPRAITFSEEVPPMMDQIRFFAGAARMRSGRPVELPVDDGCLEVHSGDCCWQHDSVEAKRHDASINCAACKNCRRSFASGCVERNLR